MSDLYYSLAIFIILIPVLLGCITFYLIDLLFWKARKTEYESRTLREEWDAHHGVKPSLFRRILNKFTANIAKKDEVVK